MSVAADPELAGGTAVAVGMTGTGVSVAGTAVAVGETGAADAQAEAIKARTIRVDTNSLFFIQSSFGFVGG
jgi:hypothetical protein